MCISVDDARLLWAAFLQVVIVSWLCHSLRYL